MKSWRQPPPASGHANCCEGLQTRDAADVANRGVKPIDHRRELRLEFGVDTARKIAVVLGIAHDVGMAVHVFDHLQASRLGAGGEGENAGQLLRINVVSPQEVVDVHARILTDEQSAHLLGEEQVVGIGDTVHISGIACGISTDWLAQQRRLNVHADRHPVGIDGVTLGILDA